MKATCWKHSVIVKQTWNLQKDNGKWTYNADDLGGCLLIKTLSNDSADDPFVA